MVSDEEIDALIDRAKPELRKAFRSILNGSAVHFFNIGSQPLTSGERWDVVACIMSEPISRLVESVTGGVEKMGLSYAKLTAPAPTKEPPSRQH
jgi:hypothetical protein